MQITQKEILQMTATIVAGVLSNPAMADITRDSYQRQCIIQETIQTVINAVCNQGITINYNDQPE